MSLSSMKNNKAPDMSQRSLHNNIHSFSIGDQGKEQDEESSGHGSESASRQTSNGSSGNGATEDDLKTIKEGLTTTETRQVFRLRILVLLLLVTVAASISYTIFHVTHQSEIETFETELFSIAERVIYELEEIIVEMSAVSGLAVLATDEAITNMEAARNSNNTRFYGWPFVTLTSFQEKAKNARLLSGALYVSINPIVPAGSWEAWDEYVQSDANFWIDKGLELQTKKGFDQFQDPEVVARSWLTTDRTVDPMHTFDSEGNPIFFSGSGPYLPRWQSSPILPTSMVNENLFEHLNAAELMEESISTKSVVLGGFHYAPPGDFSGPDPFTSKYSMLQSMWAEEEVEYKGDPMTYLAIPVFDTLVSDDRTIVAVLKSTIQWSWFLRDILPRSVFGYSVVIENQCDSIGSYTYQLDGPYVKLIGFGDLHEREFDEYQMSGWFRLDTIEDGTITGIPFNQDSCPYSFHVYPTKAAYENTVTRQPAIISFSVAAVFIVTIGMFLFYDHLVERRQKLIVAKATQSTAIVSSLFPKQVRDRLLAVEEDKNEKRKGHALLPNNHKLQSFLSDGSTDIIRDTERPIADLFPHCTVLFADIAGFTAWSSAREPAQVFILLQTVYQNFDLIAKRRKVFKVETIGDSYVAVTGLPEPQAGHAKIMAQFAWETLEIMDVITKDLESTLGPDTGDLMMRYGMHSGPVTAGVLKGDRARFQLFGDTVNTAARMESTGRRGCIQVSEATAAYLREAGKEHWLTQRPDPVEAKGKGKLTTYWVALKKNKGQSASDGGSDITKPEYKMIPTTTFGPKLEAEDKKESRLVNWATEMLMSQIKKVVIVHQRCPDKKGVNKDVTFRPEGGVICLDETKEAISTPNFDEAVAEAALDSAHVQVPEHVAKQLRNYVSMIAGAYRNNPFHCFDHAGHVSMSVAKLIHRIESPDISGMAIDTRLNRHAMAAEIHNYTHGITSDPMVAFALVFSALVHDVDHQGVSNSQLAKEEPLLAKFYRGKSIAEQNSFDIAWDLLMAKEFAELREFVFETKEELLRFRQLVVNMVMATDIFDRDLGALRKERWELAFTKGLPIAVTKDLRATIVMEYIIQASDVSHTMQHWRLYRKWNKNLFIEMYQAFKAGRMEKDPSEFWYQGELGFFDNYVIPLAKKLKECNVFGVSSDEYLGYALTNRTQWALGGEEIVKEIKEELDEIMAEEEQAVPEALVLEQAPQPIESALPSPEENATIQRRCASDVNLFKLGEE